MVAEVAPMKLRSDVMPQDLTGDKSTLVQVMGLVPGVTKPLPETMLTQIYVAKWRH